MTCPRRTMRRRRGGGEEGEEEERLAHSGSPVGASLGGHGQVHGSCSLTGSGTDPRLRCLPRSSMAERSGPTETPTAPTASNFVRSESALALQARWLCRHARTDAMCSTLQLRSYGGCGRARLRCLGTCMLTPVSGERVVLHATAQAMGSCAGAHAWTHARVDARMHAIHTYIHTACRVGTASTHGCTASRPP